MILVEYDGAYPNLCSGVLTVYIEGIPWEFGSHAMSSGGVWFDEDWRDHVDTGPWSMNEWPKDFPEEHKEETLCIINREIDWGCCGGCI